MNLLHKVIREKLLFLILAICTFLFFVNCGNVSNNSNNQSNIQNLPTSLLEGGYISGKVLSSNGLPIQNATVETNLKQTTTNNNGSYLLGPIPTGNYQLIARAVNFQPQVRENIKVFSGRITENIDFILQNIENISDSNKGISIIAITPNFGFDDDIVTLSCVGLTNTNPKLAKVLFSGKEADILDWNTKNDGRIVVKVPKEVETGIVKVLYNNQFSYEPNDIIFIAKPVILDAYPKGGLPGTVVTLYGRNFHQVVNYNIISLNSLQCNIAKFINSRQLSVIIPQNAETGKFSIKLQTPELQIEGISNVLFTILPELVYLSPQRSLPNVSINLYGKNFLTNRDNIKILLEERGEILGSEFTYLSKGKITFLAPNTTLVPPGTSVFIRIKANDIITTQALTYTSYNPLLTTLNYQNYGIYEFQNVANSERTLHLPRLDPDDAIAFISILSANNYVTEEDLSYTITSSLGNNRRRVPTGIILNNNNIKPQMNYSTFESPRIADVGSILRRGYAKYMSQSHYQNQPTTTNTAWKSNNKFNINLSSSIIQKSAFYSFSDPPPSTATFWLVNFNSINPLDPTNDELATATLLASSNHCLVYVDIASDTVVNASDAEKIAHVFDKIYQTLATACWDGISTPPEGDIDSQPKILLLLTPQINRNSNSGYVILGYFNPRDKINTLPHSAKTEIIYLWDKGYRENSANFYGTIAHELQHLIYYNQKGSEGEEWINEGLSVWAQQIAGYGFKQRLPTPVSQVRDFLNNPHKVSIVKWPNNALLANYGGSFLFIEYIFQRCGGYEAIRRLQRRNGYKGINDIRANILPLANPPVADFQEFFIDFAMALYLDNLPIPTDFPGHQPNKWHFSNLDLRTSIAGISGLKHISLDENYIDNLQCNMKSFGVDVVEYLGGNSGDLEFRLVNFPISSNYEYKMYVIYFKRGL